MNVTSPQIRRNIDAMKTALRVLAALRERQQPATKDIEELLGLAPRCSDEEMRTIAQEVVNWALRQCPELRVN